MSRFLSVRTGAVLLATLFLTVTETKAQKDQPEIKYRCPSDAPMESGETMYRTYCAVCHGTDGKGGGPATPALRDQVPDLTTLSQSHEGKYPARYVENVLRFGVEKRLSGTRKQGYANMGSSLC
jgi:mono/diheme cytochrome c family protein